MESVDERDGQKKILPGHFPFRRSFRRQVAKQVDPSNADKIPTKPVRCCSDISSNRRPSLGERASTSGICSDDTVQEYVGHNSSLLSLQPWIFKWEKYEEKGEDVSDASGRWSYHLSEFPLTLHGSPRRINPCCKKGIFKNRQEHRYTFKPVTCYENFFMSHLYTKNAGIEQCNFRSFPCSPVKCKRLPFLIDRSRKSARDGDSLGECPRNKYYKRTHSGTSTQDVTSNHMAGAAKEETNLIGFPHFPLPALKKENLKSGDSRSEAISASCSPKACRIADPHGLLDRNLFLLGVTIGVMTSVLSNKMAMEKLNKLLEHNKGLVQDLHEELEMKDSQNTSELKIETYRNQENYDASISIDALQSKILSSCDALKKMNDYSNACLAKAGDNPEALSEIEAELEAELERLEQNMNSCGTGLRMSNLTEIDLELENIVHGELREDLLDKGDGECQIGSNRDPSTASTTDYDANYSVSPKELSLRLHKVIESRLEERIKELECALEQSQTKLQLLEEEKLSSKQAFSNSETGSTSSDSPIIPLQQKHYEPLCLSLAGDSPITDSENEKLPSSMGSGQTLTLKSDQISEKEQAWEQILWGSQHDTLGIYDGDEDFIDEEGKELIQKLVEKTKQGSPALINAQRMFFLMDF